MSGTVALILAAGKGTRMKSTIPKVLHRAAGRFLLEHVVRAAREAGAGRIIAVVGHGAEQVREAIGEDIEYILQPEQLGTGHAVMQAESRLTAITGTVLVVCGDTPLLTGATLKKLLEHHHQKNAAATMLTAFLPDSTGYGRVVRGPGGELLQVVEQKDANPEQLAIREINTGTYCFNIQALFSALQQVRPQNSQGEYYLTDCIELIKRSGQVVEGIPAADWRETLGINSREQLAEAETLLRQAIRQKLMAAGVTMLDPASTFIDDTVQIGPDTVIYPFTIIEGATAIGAGCQIGPASRLVNATIGQNCQIQYSVIMDSKTGDDCQIGPYAYLRPGTELANRVKVGDFVEIKKSLIGEGSKVPHLTYVGDAIVGRNVNIGAGTITCNYDGVEKHHTRIGDGAFIGSNTNLIAPVEVGSGAYVGAGSTITKTVPAGSLGMARNKQVNYDDWAARRQRLENKNVEKDENKKGNRSLETKLTD